MQDGTYQTTQMSSTNIKCYDVDLRPGTKYIVGVCGDRRIYEWDPIMYLRTQTSQHPQRLYSIAYAADTTFFAAAGKDGYLYIYNATNRVNTIQETFRLVNNKDYLSIRVSDDSMFVAAGREDGVIDVFQRVCSGCDAGQYFDEATSTCL